MHTVTLSVRPVSRAVRTLACGGLAIFFSAGDIPAQCDTGCPVLPITDHATPPPDLDRRFCYDTATTTMPHHLSVLHTDDGSGVYAVVSQPYCDVGVCSIDPWVQSAVWMEETCTRITEDSVLRTASRSRSTRRRI